MNAKPAVAANVTHMALAVAAAVVTAGCRTAVVNTVTQVSTADALERGDVRGRISCAGLRRYGDFGYGIGEHLGGQFVLLNGRFHRVGPDGRLRQPHPEKRLAFAAVSPFRWDQAITIGERTDLKKLIRTIADVPGTKNDLRAIKLQGRFLEIRTFTLDTVRADGVRYTEVAGKRPVMAHEDITGTILGYRTPAYMQGLALPGYRLFFVSENLEFGGEIVDFTLLQGVVEIDTCDRLHVLLGDLLSQ